MASAKFNTPIPASLLARPRDKRGYPIPHGVWCNPETGEYDFRILDPLKRIQALEEKRCAVSGELLPEGEYWFIGGPGSFTSRLFLDGPMLLDVAEFSLRVCPHLALAASQYRRSGGEEKFNVVDATVDKAPLLMLAMSRSYQLEEIKGTLYVRAGTWTAVSCWRDGERLRRAETLAILAEVAPELAPAAPKPESAPSYSIPDK